MDRSFCLTRSTFHRYCLRAFALCLAFSLCASIGHAQGRRGSGGGGFRFGGDNGGGTPGGGVDFMRLMDRNNDGELDEDEVPERMRSVLEARGIDVSRGVSREDFEGAREDVRTELQSGGDGGSRRGFGFGDGEGWGRGGEDGRGRGDRDENRDQNRDEKKPRPRVTFDLPASHAPADTDGDGQLGMYEWRRWSGHSLREFLELDGNGDGFVTPREVYVVIGFPDQDTVAGNSRESGSRTGEATTVSVPSGTSAPADSGGRVAAEATRYFGILDKDEDGAISAEEWASSIRIRGMFEDGGLDLSEPMPQDTFVQNYVSLSSADG